MSASPAPGFEKHPSHRVDLSAADRRVYWMKAQFCLATRVMLLISPYW